MLLDVLFSRNELKAMDLEKSVVVVADVLRATTVMIEALQHGAVSILPQENDATARGVYTVLQEQGIPVLLGGEKDGFKRKGYDLGNSPLEYAPEVVRGKTLVHLTTNGTKALVAASAAQAVYIASFNNVSAVADTIVEREASIPSVLFVVAGRLERYCLEDTVCLGAIITRILERSSQKMQLTDSAITAADLYSLYKDRLLEMVQRCTHGRYLEEVGLGEDLPACVQVDTREIVPEMRNGKITRASHDGVFS